MPGKGFFSYANVSKRLLRNCVKSTLTSYGEGGPEISTFPHNIISIKAYTRWGGG